VFSSSDLIEALQRHLRKGRSIRPPRPPGEFPPGWTAWFSAMATRAGQAAGGAVDAAEAFVGIFTAREPAPPPRAAPAPSRWQASARLLFGDPEDTPRDDRRARIASTVLTLLFHILWIQALFWLMYARFVGYPGEEEARLGEEHVVQVEFIGDGTPVETAGGAQLEENPVPDVASSPAPAAAAATQPPTAQALPEPSVAREATPVPEIPPPPADQRLQVTETPQPDSTFVVPPTRMAEVPVRNLPTPELRVPSAELRTVDVPTRAPPPEVRRLPERDITVPDLRQREVDIVQREVPAPAPEVAMRTPQRPAAPSPELRREGPQVAQRDVPLRTTGAATAGASESREAGRADGQRTAAGAAQTAAGTSGGQRAAGQGTSATASTAGSGTTSTPAAGALASPRRGDDWGDSTRNRPGGQAGSPSGLFNADGSPRLAGGTGRAGGGLPPGTITEDYEKIDRMGTWLKRPPVGYEPTSLDRFWVPHETLLEEWVRKSIKEVLIPIPGTSKRIKCAVALLMLGGACGITDPNMLDNEAEARKPPDVPFKRDLQEDQDSLKPATPP